MTTRAEELAAQLAMEVVAAVRNGKDPVALGREYFEQYGQEVREAAARECEGYPPDYETGDNRFEIATSIREMDLP
jgi:hypothetical protein